MNALKKESAKGWRTISTYNAYNALCTHDDLYLRAKAHPDTLTLYWTLREAYKRVPFDCDFNDVSYNQLKESLYE